ncbi:ketopantoate reductase family protein [Thalassolituus sp. LLYu03]|uniref:ketopantoate reductase family protein n=1 Tax=Thalassolituus sp. LLYu03 TaxID=3421656 RepID=UPI003D2A93AA
MTIKHSLHSQHTLRIGLLGLGAVGTLMAGYWRDLRPVALPRNPDPLNPENRGTNNGEKRVHLQALDGSVSELVLPCWHGETLDWLVVTTKAADTLNALQNWRAQLPAVRRILLLQNGMGQQDQVADWLAQEGLTDRCELWAGISTEGAYRTTSGDTDNGSTERVVHAGSGATLAGRWLAGDNDSAPLPPGIQYHADIRGPMREKLAINAVINPLTGLLRCANGELVSNPDYRQQLEALAQEVAGFYAAMGWPLNTPLTERAAAVASATAANRSSTLQDILAGRATELPWIGGYLLHCAQESGYSLPLTRQLLLTLDASGEPQAPASCAEH